MAIKTTTGNRFYTLLKFSYSGEGQVDCILPGLSCGMAKDLDALLDLVEKHLAMTNVKTAWVPTDSNDEHLFYVTYKDAFEEQFHHGFKVQAMDTTTGRVWLLTKATDSEEVSAIQRLTTELKGVEG